MFFQKKKGVKVTITGNYERGQIYFIWVLLKILMGWSLLIVSYKTAKRTKITVRKICETFFFKEMMLRNLKNIRFGTEMFTFFITSLIVELLTLVFSDDNQQGEKLQIGTKTIFHSFYSIIILWNSKTAIKSSFRVRTVASVRHKIISVDKISTRWNIIGYRNWLPHVKRKSPQIEFLNPISTVWTFTQFIYLLRPILLRRF